MVSLKRFFAFFLFFPQMYGSQGEMVTAHNSVFPLEKLPLDVRVGIEVELFDLIRISQVNKALNSAVKASINVFSLNLLSSLYLKKPMIHAAFFNLVAGMQRLDSQITFESDFLNSAQFKNFRANFYLNDEIYYYADPLPLLQLFLTNFNLQAIACIQKIKKCIYQFNGNNQVSSDVIAEKFGLKNYCNFYERYYSAALCLWAFYAEGWQKPEATELDPYVHTRYEAIKTFVELLFSLSDPLFNIKVTRNLLSNRDLYFDHFAKIPTSELKCDLNGKTLRDIYFSIRDEDKKSDFKAIFFIKMNIRQFVKLLQFYAYMYNADWRFHNFHGRDYQRICVEHCYPEIEKHFKILRDSSYIDDYTTPILKAIHTVQSHIRKNAAIEKLETSKSVITIQAMIRRYQAYQVLQNLPYERFCDRLKSFEETFNLSSEVWRSLDEQAELRSIEMKKCVAAEQALETARASLSEKINAKATKLKENLAIKMKQEADLLTKGTEVADKISELETDNLKIPGMTEFIQKLKAAKNTPQLTKLKRFINQCFNSWATLLLFITGAVYFLKSYSPRLFHH